MMPTRKIPPLRDPAKITTPLPRRTKTPAQTLKERGGEAQLAYKNTG